MDNNCIFCDIVNKEEFAAVLYEDDDIMAFMDIKPINEGHALVITKKHAILVDELEEKLYLKLFPIGRKIAMKIKKVFPETKGIMYFIADGEHAGQEVPHVHLHIIPRKPNDGFDFTFEKTYYDRLLTEEERTKVKEKLIPI